MNKRIESFALWQSTVRQADAHFDVTQAMAAPLLVVGGLLVLDGVFSASVTSLAIGVMTLIAARALK